MLTIYIRKIRILNLVYKQSEIRWYKKLESIFKLGTSSYKKYVKIIENFELNSSLNVHARTIRRKSFK